MSALPPIIEPSLIAGAPMNRRGLKTPHPPLFCTLHSDHIGVLDTGDRVPHLEGQQDQVHGAAPDQVPSLDPQNRDTRYGKAGAL